MRVGGKTLPNIRSPVTGKKKMDSVFEPKNVTDGLKIKNLCETACINYRLYKREKYNTDNTGSPEDY
jgi:hypothetical protein